MVKNKQYRERFYKSFVSIYNWPVVIHKPITNNTLPELREDFLNMSLEEMPYHIGAIALSDGNNIKKLF